MSSRFLSGGFTKSSVFSSYSYTSSITSSYTRYDTVRSPFLSCRHLAGLSTSKPVNKVALKRKVTQNILKNMPALPQIVPPVKPGNSYSFFVKSNAETFKDCPPELSAKKVVWASKKIAEMWHNTSPSAKKLYFDKASVALEKYKKDYAEYLKKLTPAHHTLIRKINVMRKALGKKVQKPPVNVHLPKRPTSAMFCFMRDAGALPHSKLADLIGENATSTLVKRTSALSKVWNGMSSGDREKYTDEYKRAYEQWFKENAKYLANTKESTQTITDMMAALTKNARAQVMPKKKLVKKVKKIVKKVVKRKLVVKKSTKKLVAKRTVKKSAKKPAAKKTTAKKTAAKKTVKKTVKKSAKKPAAKKVAKRKA